MPRAPNPLTRKAEKLYQKGMSLAQIAEKLGVPAGTVRRWKSTGGWDNERSECSEKTNTEETSVRKVQGAPKGNKNAVGNHGGAPRGNTNSMKHGAYRQIFEGILPEEEHAFAQGMSFDQADLIRQEIATLTTRERYLMQEIVKLRSNSSSLAIHTVCRDGDDTSTTAVNTIQYIRVYEAELTKVQRAKAMYVRMLMEVEKQKLDEPTSGQDEVDLSGISEEELRRLATLVEECEETEQDSASGEEGACTPAHG